jgi:hypothetical protein
MTSLGSPLFLEGFGSYFTKDAVRLRSVSGSGSYCQDTELDLFYFLRFPQQIGPVEFASRFVLRRMDLNEE